MGFLGPEKYATTELDVKLDGRGNYQTPLGKYTTSINGVYAAGGKIIAIFITKEEKWNDSICLSRVKNR